jgi:pilus assembly protein CpaE
MSTLPAIANLPDISAVSVALIVPDPGPRQALAKLLAEMNVPIRECANYPNPAVLDELIETGCDVFIVELNANAAQALALIENICTRNSAATVMAYSSGPQSELLAQSMRAGAREFLTAPVVQSVMAEALAQALVRREKTRRQKAIGKIFVFAGAKGGAGTTTIATNFAIALADEGAGKVVVVDLDIYSGDVALALGLSPKFSILDALQNVARMDSVFLLSLLGKHTSGLSVLAASEPHTPVDILPSAVDRLLRIVRGEFAFVVVDAGPLGGPVTDVLYDLADTIFLITEASIPALRNARRILSLIAGRDRNSHPEVILNRFNSKEVDIDENSVAKALARPANWRIPNDFPAVRSAENAGIPLAMKNSAITRVLRQIAKAACGKPVDEEKKGRSLLSLFQ